MLKWAFLFLLLGLVAGALGLTGLADVSVGIAMFLFFAFLVLFLVLLLLGLKAFRNLHLRRYRSRRAQT